MPVWMVELFGSAQINRAFWGMNLLVMPFWLAMILAPRSRWVRTFSHPFFIPALFAFVYLYALYLLVTVTGLPPLVGLEMQAMRDFVHHPLVFLVVWAHYLAVDLFLGMSIFRDAAYRRLQVPVELFLCWIFGPLGLIAYALRLGWMKLVPR